MEEKIQRELMAAASNKTPGPNGLTFKFAQFYWLIFRYEVVALFNQLHERADFD